MFNVVGIYVYYGFLGNSDGHDCLPPAGKNPILIGYLNTMAKPIHDFIMTEVKNHYSNRHRHG